MPEWQIRRFDVIDSTNRYLVDEAAAGSPEGIVAVAQEQVHGRGRFDRKWIAPPGSSLLVSVLLRPHVDVERFQLLTVVASLSVLDACRSVCSAPVGLKWPNDVVVRGRKVGGVLVEAGWLPDARTPAWAVVGLGLNVVWTKEMEAEPELSSATALSRECSEEIESEALLSSYLDALERRYGAWERDGAIGEVITEYRAELTTLGTSVHVAVGGDEFEGTAIGVDEVGHLQVETADGVRTVLAADVVHVRGEAS